MSRPSVAIVGGGLAGIAAAVALADHGCSVTLFEARRRLGGRAASYRDPASGELVDHCQHVSMGCCTNLEDLCRRTGTWGDFRRDRVIHVVDPTGRHLRIAAASWLPAPLHLLPSLFRLKFLSLRERWQVARGMAALLRWRAEDSPGHPTLGQWLRDQGQSNRAVEQFWSLVLVSALGECIDQVSVAAARKVFLDGFAGCRAASHLLVPLRPLAELIGDRMDAALRARGVRIALSAAVAGVAFENNACRGVQLAGGGGESFDCVVLAVPWRQVRRLVPVVEGAAFPDLETCSSLEGAPITGIHLWSDQALMDLPHAVLVGRTAQWVFRPPYAPHGAIGSHEHYYQVVVSGSWDLVGRTQEEVARQVWRELLHLWPRHPTPRLLRFRVVTEREAVFSPRPGVERLRPPQRTTARGLYLAGDWTATGWPATMEGAVRSGYLAAEALLAGAGRHCNVVVPNLPRAPLVRWFFGEK